MKLSCLTSDLQQALQLASRAISGQQALPILGNIHLRAHGNSCTVSATDLELSIITTFPATVEEEGVITVPAKAILNFAQYTSDAEVKMETKDESQLRCSSGHSKTILSGEAASEYPTIPSIEKKMGFRLDAASLLEALHYVTFASARTTLRPVLSGVYVRSEAGGIIFVSTDSYRLSEYTIPTEVDGSLSCIIPVKVLDELKVFLASKKPPKRSPTEEGEKEGAREEALPVHITLSEQQVEIRVGSTQLLSRLIEGKFPDYRQIIPKEHTLRATLSTRELITTVKRMHYFAKEVNNNLTFSFSPTEVHITTPETQGGKDEGTIPVELSGKEGKIALSSSYLLDFLGHVDRDTVEIRMTDSMHPAVFYLPGNERLLHLIMPLRMQEGA